MSIRKRKDLLFKFRYREALSGSAGKQEVNLPAAWRAETLLYIAGSLCHRTEHGTGYVRNLLLGSAFGTPVLQLCMSPCGLKPSRLGPSAVAGVEAEMATCSVPRSAKDHALSESIVSDTCCITQIR